MDFCLQRGVVPEGLTVSFICAHWFLFTVGGGSPCSLGNTLSWSSFLKLFIADGGPCVPLLVWWQFGFKGSDFSCGKWIVTCAKRRELAQWTFGPKSGVGVWEFFRCRSTWCAPFMQVLDWAGFINVPSCQPCRSHGRSSQLQYVPNLPCMFV